MSRSWFLFFALCAGAWVAAGIVFLIPLKVRIMRRAGRLLSTLQLRAMARAGDPEAQVLRRASGAYAVVGVTLFVAGMLVRGFG